MELHHLPMAVFEPPWSVLTVLVPLDGSTVAERAIPYAVALGQADGARLVLAGRIPSESGHHPATAAGTVAYLGHVARPLAGCGLPVQTTVTNGTGALPIIAAVRLWRADLVVMASPEASAARAAEAATIAEQILRRTGVPVLLVPAPRPAAQHDAPARDDRILDLRWQRPTPSWPTRAGLS